MRWICGIISALVFANIAIPLSAADVPAILESTLFSGEFDGVLRIAADHEGKRLSGYFNDGKCRFALGGALKPVLLYGRPDYGEAYEIEGWNPATPDKRFSIEMNSMARNGFQGLISLRFGGGDTPTTSKCSWRRTLDRANNMSSTYIAVRVVRKSRPRIYDLEKPGDPPQLKLQTKGWPAKGSAVWVTRSTTKEYSPKGFVYIGWYPAEGPPKGGYIRERDLYAMPTDAQ
jgi:hypothetical protein